MSQINLCDNRFLIYIYIYLIPKKFSFLIVKAMSSNVASSSTSNLPKVEQVKSWSRENVKKFLQDNRASLYLEDGDIDNIYNQRVDGATFLELTQEDLAGIGILLGPAKKIVKLIKGGK